MMKFFFKAHSVHYYFRFGLLFLEAKHFIPINNFRESAPILTVILTLDVKNIQGGADIYRTSTWGQWNNDGAQVSATNNHMRTSDYCFQRVTLHMGWVFDEI